MNEKNIYQRMSAITAELRTVAKNLNIETGKGKGYKAVGEVDVLNAVKPLEEKHGVYSYPCSREILESAMLESESTYGDKTTKKTTFFERIKTVYRFVNVDKPEEYVETITFAEGIDSQDKGSGKAMTYGDKYALMKAYKISTGDDPDQNASEEHFYSSKSAAMNEAEIAKQKSIYISTITQLLADTETDGLKMLEFVNEKCGIKAQAFSELSLQQMIYVIQKLEQKKAKK